MDVFTKNRVTAWGMTVLVLLNLLLLSVLWWGHIHRVPLQRLRDDGPVPHDQAMIRFLEHELDLDAGQVKQLQHLFEQHVAQVTRVMQDMHAYREAMQRAVFAEDANDTDVAELAEKIGRKQAQTERLRYQHFKDIAALCNPQQRKKFRHLMEDILLKAGPPESGPAPGPRGGPLRGDGRGPGPGPRGGLHDGPGPPGPEQGFGPPPLNPPPE